MSQEPRGPEDMREEYDFPPGQGVRGKYYERYRRSFSITTAESPFVCTTSTGAQHPVPRVTMPVAYPVHLPSPKLQVASFPTVHASQDPARG
jgi:hypothetical protein